MQDLSKTVFASDPISVLVPTSQEGGNMRASNELAMTAPGSQPVDVMQPAGNYFNNDPTVIVSNTTAIDPGMDGKPQASGQSRDYAPSAPAWTSTGSPDTVRTPMPSRRQDQDNP